MKIFDMNVCKTLKTSLLYFSYEGDRKGFWQFFALRKFYFRCLIVHLIINFTFFSLYAFHNASLSIFYHQHYLYGIIVLTV